MRPDAHLAALRRVYGEETWSLYRELDRSLEPRGPDWLHERAARELRPGATILDAGCRDAAHLIRLVRDNEGVTGAGIEPVPIHLERARRAVAGAGLEGRVRIVAGGMEACPFPDGHFDLIWCRDVLEQVEPLVPALRESARVLAPSGRMLAFTVVATDLLEPRDAALLRRHLGNVDANLHEPTLLAGFDAAGLAVLERDVIGTEWQEHAEERHRPVSRALLRLARLRRRRDEIVAEHGEDVCGSVEANLHWEAFQMLGKLLPVVYVLARRCRNPGGPFDAAADRPRVRGPRQPLRRTPGR